MTTFVRVRVRVRVRGRVRGRVRVNNLLLTCYLELGGGHSRLPHAQVGRVPG